MKYGALVILLMAAACSPTRDLQGQDPIGYYAEHPVVNTLETRALSYPLPFAKNGIGMADKSALRAKLDAINPLAVEEVALVMHPSQQSNKARVKALAQVLKSAGVKVSPVVTGDKDIARGEGRLDIRYAVVVPPRCPDWRRSPVTTYSNTQQGNFGCAGVVNLGRMVADPHDLAKGSGSVTPDPTYTSTTISSYRTGAAPAEQ